MRCLLGVLAFLLLLPSAGCVSSRIGASGPADPVRWPFAGLNQVQGALLGLYQDRVFSGYCLEFEPGGARFFAEAGRSGALSVVPVPEGMVSAILELGEGSLVENLAFPPGGDPLYVVASTVRAENAGRVPLARALLKIDPGMFLLQAAIPLKPVGYCHGLALLPRRGMVFCLDSAGPGVAGGATLTRIDVLTNEADLRRPVGSLPAAVRRRGLVMDERQNRVFALLAAGEAGSDFDPAPAPSGGGGSHLAAISPDSLGIVETIPLPDGLDYLAVAATPDGVMVVGTSRRGTSLLEIDTRLMRQIGWVDLPEPVSDVAVAGETAILPGAHGLYVIDLNLFALRGSFPYDLYRPEEAGLSADAGMAAVLVESRDRPGRMELLILDMATGGIIQVTR